MTALELTQEIACVLDKKKAKDIKAIYIRDLTILADYFVICTGTSTTQVKALADEDQVCAHARPGGGVSVFFLDFGGLRQCSRPLLPGGHPRFLFPRTALDGRTAG